MDNNLKIILNLFNIVKEINGTGKIHRIVYILKNKGLNITYKFYPYYYELYSSDLNLGLDYLIDNNFLKITQKFNDNFFYYSLNKKLSDKLIDNEINRFSDLINDLNNKNVEILGLVAIIFYLKNSGIIEQEKIIKKINILKPNLILYLNEALDLFNKFN